MLNRSENGRLDTNGVPDPASNLVPKLGCSVSVPNAASIVWPEFGRSLSRQEVANRGARTGTNWCELIFECVSSGERSLSFGVAQYQRH
jgi:hypothetical protein